MAQGPMRVNKNLDNNTIGAYVRYDFKNLANNGTVDTPSFTVNENGLYIVRFDVAQCGANSMTKVGGFWSAKLKRTRDSYVLYPMHGARDTVAIPLGSSWDYEVSVLELYALDKNETYIVTFENSSGRATHAEYNSRVSVAAIRIGIVM